MLIIFGLKIAQSSPNPFSFHSFLLPAQTTKPISLLPKRNVLEQALGFLPLTSERQQKQEHARAAERGRETREGEETAEKQISVKGTERRQIGFLVKKKERKAS